MYSLAMLTEIVKAGPNLFTLGTVGRSTTETPIGPISRGDLVNTLHMPLCIIMSTKGFRAMRALMWFGVSRSMFSVTHPH